MLAKMLMYETFEPWSIAEPQKQLLDCVQTINQQSFRKLLTLPFTGAYALVRKSGG